MNDLALDPDLILRHIQDGLLIVDTEGRVLFTNAAFREMIGREEEDLVGRRCCELGVGGFCKDHCPVTAGGGAACEDGTRFDAEVGGTDGRGRPGAYCVVTSRVLNDDGKVLGWFENFRQVDQARERVLEHEARSSSPGEADGLLRALESNRWSVARTAQDLGVSRTTLWRKMRRLGIDRKA